MSNTTQTTKRQYVAPRLQKKNTLVRATLFSGGGGAGGAIVQG
ncbi:MAG: hypothetical protein ACJA1R_002517 [Flavobacteriales bacterium]|jgi:hypothetical protein